MRAGSLCTGGGGLDIGLASVLDIEWAWHCESDEAASAVLDHHYPGVPNHGDLVNFDWATAEPVDLVTAGFPCPDYSHAGRRAGIGGGHGQIWFGVAAALRTLRPRYIVLENVPGIRTAAGLRIDAGESALGVVLADLAEIGYRWAYDCMRAADLGAPHRRDRWFLVGRLAANTGSEGRRQVAGGAPRDEGAAGGWPEDADHELGRTGPSGLRTADRVDHLAADAGSFRRDGGGEGDQEATAGDRTDGRPVAPRPPAPAADAGSEPAEPGRGRRAAGGAHTRRGTPERDRHRHDGTAKQGPPLETSPDTAGELRDGWTAGEDGDARGRQETERPQGDADARDGSRVAWGTYEPAIRRWESILGRGSPDPTDDRGRLNPRFVEWMLGYPDGWVSDIDIPRTAQLRILGNSVQVQCAEQVGEWLERLTTSALL